MGRLRDEFLDWILVFTLLMIFSTSSLGFSFLFLFFSFCKALAFIIDICVT